jgi:simple sugar transport system ATP-binding protein
VVSVDGHPATIRSPRDARRLGLGMVHQHFTSVPAFTVAENVALAAGWPARPRENARRVGELAARLGLALDPAARAGLLSVGLRQRLEIVKALAPGARVLLLDEPTGVLAPAEVEDLFATVRGFVGEGGAAVLITHALDEALAVADRVTVLRAGRVTLSGPAAEQDHDALARAMLGTEPARHAPVPPSIRPAVVVRFDRVTIPAAAGRGPGARDVSLTVHAGEIVGVAAVEGNGQRELLRAAAGVLAHARGSLDRTGEAVLIPEDRTTEALLPDFSLTENAALGLADRPGWSERGLMRWREARQRTAVLLREHDVRAPGPDVSARTLSGGNQQKLVVARALAAEPALVVAEHPARGLDIGATGAVHADLRRAAAAGAAVLFHSPDLAEVLGLATRVVVMTGGRLVEVGAGAGREEVGRVMVGSRES